MIFVGMFLRRFKDNALELSVQMIFILEIKLSVILQGISIL
jgi:hypothetical protein